MKIHFDRQQFSDAFTAVASAINSRTTKEVLKFVHVQAEGELATLTVTDTETSIVIKTPVEVEHPGVTLLPADRVGRMLRESIDEHATIDAGDTVIFRCGRAKWDVPTANPDEFPKPGDIKGDAFDVSSSELKLAIERTIFATDPDSSRYALGAVLLTTHNSGLALVGTDGRRLANALLGAGKETPPLLIHPKAAALILKVNMPEVVRVSSNPSYVQVSSDTMSLLSRQVEGRYPNWQQVIPGLDIGYEPVKVTAGALLSAINQAAIVADQETRGVDFAFTKNKVGITAKGGERGSSAISVEVEYLGSDVTIKLDHRYVRDFLKVHESNEMVTAYVASSTQSVLLCSGDNYRYVVMPMALER